MITTYERGKIDGWRETLLMQLDDRFGPLPPEVGQRVERLKPDELRTLLRDVVKASSLKDLHLQD